MSNDANRTLIVLAAAVWIVLMAVLVFLTWSADTDVIDRIGDFQEYLAENNDDAGKLIVTLGALVTVVLALLVIIIEVAPEDEERELRVEQAGATTIVPAGALRQRLEEAVMGIPQVTAAKAKVASKDKGIAAALDLTLVSSANVASVTQDAIRVVTDTVQADLGLPVVGVPTVRITFAKPSDAAAARFAMQHDVRGQPVTPQASPASEEQVHEWFGGPQQEEPAAQEEPPEEPWSSQTEEQQQPSTEGGWGAPQTEERRWDAPAPEVRPEGGEPGEQENRQP